MDYRYGTFSDEQMRQAALLMHNKIHRLLLYKDSQITELIFADDEEFFAHFERLLYRFGGMNSMFNEPPLMIAFMSSLEAAYLECKKPVFQFKRFRKLILDCHGYLRTMFGEVR